MLSESAREEVVIAAAATADRAVELLGRIADALETIAEATDHNTKLVAQLVVGGRGALLVHNRGN